MDNFTKVGADRIALAIVRYWHERGHKTVQAWLYRIDDVNWGVRSNLVGGQPPSPARLALAQRRLEFLG